MSVQTYRGSMAATFALGLAWLVSPNAFAQAAGASAVLQQPWFILTCDLLGRVRREQEYFADSMFEKDLQECAKNPKRILAYTQEQWSAATYPLAQSLEVMRKSSHSSPQKYNEVLALQDRLQYFSKWVPGIAREAARTIARQSGDSPLEAMTFDASTDAVGRVTRFFDYLMVRAEFSDLDQRANNILKEALDAKKLPPVLPATWVAMTCVDVVKLLNGLPIAYAAAVEPVFGACYEKPNSYLGYNLDQLAEFLQKTNADFPTTAGLWTGSTFSQNDQLGRRFSIVAAPYARAAAAENARIAAEQQRSAQLAESQAEVDAVNQQINSKMAEHEVLVGEKYDIAVALTPNFESPPTELQQEQVSPVEAAHEAEPAAGSADPWSVVMLLLLLGASVFAVRDAVRYRRAKPEPVSAFGPNYQVEYFGSMVIAFFAAAFLMAGTLAVAFLLENFVDGALSAVWRRAWLVFGLLFGAMYWFCLGISKYWAAKQRREAEEERQRQARHAEEFDAKMLDLEEEEAPEIDFEEEQEERERRQCAHERELELLDLRIERDRERNHQKHLERERLERKREEQNRDERDKRAEKERRERESRQKDEAIRERDRLSHEEAKRRREEENRRKDEERREQQHARREKAEYERRERELEIVYTNKNGYGFHTMPGGSSAAGARMFAEAHLRHGSAAGYVIRNKNGKVVGSG